MRKVTVVLVVSLAALDAADALLTSAALAMPAASEGNPAAAWMVAHGGIVALLVAKLLAGAGVIAIAFVLDRMFPRATRAALMLAILALAIVDAHSLMLIWR